MLIGTDQENFNIEEGLLKYGQNQIIFLTVVIIVVFLGVTVVDV